jgi:Leucine-rich repeat (LRR) protein
MCELNNIEVSDVTQNIIIGGNHMANRSNDDVEVVVIKNSNTPRMIPQIFMTFRNIIELEMIRCKLETISIPSSIRLEVILLYGNNISNISKDDLLGQSELLYFDAVDNDIQSIGENAFDDLEKLIYLILMNNNIEKLDPKSFQPLKNLRYLDLEGNKLTHISEELLSSNPRLREVYLEFNKINEISPRFAGTLQESLLLLNLQANACVSKAFILESKDDWAQMNTALETCFRNYNDASQTKRITIEFTGMLVILDEDGNVLTRL